MQMGSAWVHRWPPISVLTAYTRLHDVSGSRPRWGARTWAQRCQAAWTKHARASLPHKRQGQRKNSTSSPWRHKRFSYEFSCRFPLMRKIPGRVSVRWRSQAAESVMRAAATALPHIESEHVASGDFVDERDRTIRRTTLNSMPPRVLDSIQTFSKSAKQKTNWPQANA